MSDIQHYTPLRLKAHDADHLIHLSTLLQDGLFPITSMVYDSTTHVFSCLANRFCWEMMHHYDLHDHYFRVHTGLVFKHVYRVFKRNFHQKHPVRTLNLLMISVDAMPDAAPDATHHDPVAHHHIRLLFSGDRELSLHVTDIDIRLNDFQHPWPTQTRPKHIHEHIDEHLADDMITQTTAGESIRL